MVGPLDPTRASLGFQMTVNGAMKNEIQTSIAIVGDAAELLKPGAADQVRGGGMPPFAELFAGCVSAGVKVYVERVARRPVGSPNRIWPVWVPNT